MSYKIYPVLFNGEMVRAVLAGQKTQTRRPIKPQPSDKIIRYARTRDLMADVWNRYYEEGYREWMGVLPDGAMTCHRDCPYGLIGDHLWVRETFVLEDTDEMPTDGRPYREMEEPGEFGQLLVPHYRATEPEPHIVPLDLSDSYDDRTRWHPSIFMPHWASRITLEVTNVRVERVQDITDDDAWEEGAWWWRHDDAAGPPFYVRKGYNVECFSELWDSIYAKPKPVYRDKQIVHYISYPWEADTETREHRGLPWFVYGNPWTWAVSFKKLEG